MFPFIEVINRLILFDVNLPLATYTSFVSQIKPIFTLPSFSPSITLIFLPTNSPNVTYSSNIFFPLLARFTSMIINTACFSSITFL